MSIESHPASLVSIRENEVTMPTIACPSCGASGSTTIDSTSFEIRGQWRGKSVRRCRACGAGMTVHLGFRGVKAKLLDEELWARMQVEWHANGPGKRDLVSAIFEGRSDGAGAFSRQGEPIQGGEPFDRERMEKNPPLGTPFRYVCGEGHPMPSVLVFTFEVNSGICYGNCDICDPALTKLLWAYEHWDPADEPEAAEPRNGIPPPSLFG